MKLFRVTISTNRTEFIATNDLSQDSTEAVQEVYGIRWKIEEFHREIKQLTGIESCQCRFVLKIYGNSFFNYTPVELNIQLSGV